MQDLNEATAGESDHQGGGHVPELIALNPQSVNHMISMAANGTRKQFTGEEIALLGYKLWNWHAALILAQLSTLLIV